MADLIVQVVISEPATVNVSVVVGGTRGLPGLTGETGATGATGPAGAGVTDGDKGDITVTDSGETWTIDADAKAAFPVSTPQATADAAIGTAAASDATTKANAAQAAAIAAAATDATTKANAAQAAAISAAATDATTKASAAVSTSEAYSIQRANHTGTQLLATISDAGNAAGKNVGTTSGTVAAGDDSRLTDSRTPAAHASSHASAGSDPITISESQVTNLTTDLAAKEATANKNASGGYAGLTLLKLNLKNALGTIISFFTTAATVARTWTLPDKDGTVAMTSDITGTNSGTNTGDQTITLTGGVTGSGTGSFAATVVTNANLTGDVTSVGNAATIPTSVISTAARTVTDDATVAAMVDTLGGAASTGTGGLVRATSPTLVTPILGTPTSGVATNLTGTAAGLTAGNVTTNANLTGDVTSVGNATTLATVSIAKGGTGQTTAYAANDALHVKGADIASATTTDLSAATGDFVDVTGTVTITGLGTSAAGVERTVRFTGALTLTHNATSLILPGAVNITTVASDRAIFRSLGSGNWLCVVYVPATVTGTGSQVRSTAPTFPTTLTCPNLVGGTGTTSTLIIQATSANAIAGANIIFKGGNNASSTLMTITSVGDLLFANGGFSSSSAIAGGLFQFTNSTAGAFGAAQASQFIINSTGADHANQNSLAWATTTNAGTLDLFLTRVAPANLRNGLPDAAAPVAQTSSVQSVVAGTSNTAGAVRTMTDSAGTGSGGSGGWSIQVAPAGGSGTAQNPFAEAIGIASTKVVTFAGIIINSAQIRLKSYTVATLPSPTQGDYCYVTNALAPAYGVAVTGGGAVVTPVFYDGSAWTTR